jgi:polyketide biosynthesis enoyl-CoA hydratase PksI
MSEVVRISYPEPPIALVQLQDRRHRNGFSPELVNGLVEGFEQLRWHEPRIKCVVVHGYDRIFSAGGTREELLELQQGRKNFTELGFYRLLLDFEVPVIAAMQGHAIGGGLVFGFYADVVMLAEECLYTANFMSYGFTPGMGATLLLPEKLGPSLACEMLYSARSYHGGDLRRRGAPLRVLPQEQVLESALELAREIAEKPRPALCLLKETLTAPLRQRLEATVQRELAMHKATFHQPAVRQQIEAITAS